MVKIEAKGLTKVYGDTVALDDVQFTLDEPKIYGLLGRNAQSLSGCAEFYSRDSSGLGC